MFNVLSKEEKNMVRTEYFARLVVVVLLFISFAVLIGFITSIPTYFLLKGEHDSLVSLITKHKNAELSAKQDRMIIDLKDKINILQSKTGDTHHIYNTIIAELLSKRNGLQITDIDYRIDGVSKKGAQVRLSGKSPDRNTLKSFLSELRALPFVDVVDAPIANFVKRSDIDFSISISLHQNI